MATTKIKIGEELEAVTSKARRVVIDISIGGIQRRPVLGGGCCAIPAMVAVKEALESAPGIDSIEEGKSQSDLSLRLDYEYSTTPEVVIGEAVEVIRCLGYRFRSILILDQANRR